MWILVGNSTIASCRYLLFREMLYFLQRNIWKFSHIKVNGWTSKNTLILIYTLSGQLSLIIRFYRSTGKSITRTNPQFLPLAILPRESPAHEQWIVAIIKLLSTSSNHCQPLVSITSHYQLWATISYELLLTTLLNHHYMLSPASNAAAPPCVPLVPPPQGPLSSSRLSHSGASRGCHSEGYQLQLVADRSYFHGIW